MTEEKNRHIAFICSMGWAALGDGIDVTIFFTFWGLDLVTEKRVDKLEVAPVANTSFKMKLMGLPTGNWGIPNLMGALPGMTAFASWFMKKKIEELEVPPVREYIEMLSDAGANMYGCKMTVDMFGLKDDDFVPAINSVVTASDFMDMTEGAQIVFI